MHSISISVSGTTAAGIRTRSVCCADTAVMDMPTDSGDAVRQNNSSILVLRHRMHTKDRLIAAVTGTAEAAVIDRTETPVAAVSHGTSFKKL